MIKPGEALRGLSALPRLAWATRGRLTGRYWRWRIETAFGRGRPGWPEIAESTLAYGAWASRLRRLGRSRIRPRRYVPSSLRR